MSRVDDLYLHEDEDVDDGDDTSPLLINSGTDAAANNNSSSSTASPLPARPTTPRSQQQQQYQERMMADRTPLLLDKETIRAQVQAQLAATSRRGSGNNVAVAVVDNGSSTQGNINSRGSQDGEEGEDDYVTADDDPIGDALQRCFHEVIRPFGMFLCVIGWRPFVGAPTVVSNLYVVSIGLLLMCNYVYNVLYAVYGDRGSLLSEYIVQAVLSFGVWAYGTYHFHREEGKAFQEIAALIETVFLRCSDAQTGKLTQTALTNTLRSYLAYGCYALICYLTIALWIAFSNGIDLYNKYQPPTWVFVTMATFVCLGYVAEYAVYICTVLVYFLCARLVIRYMDWLRDELVRRNIDLPNAEKEIFIIRKLLNDLNMGWAPALSAVTVSFFILGILYHVRIFTSETQVESWQAGVESAVAFLLCLVAVYPAMHITWKGERLKSMAWKIRGELPYRTATRDDIDSFNGFFSHAHLAAKVLGMPVHPQIVYSILLIVLVTVVMFWRFGMYNPHVSDDSVVPPHN